MEGAWGTCRGTSGMVTVAGSGMEGATVPTVPGGKGDEDETETWRVGGLCRALVMFVRSLREKASMLMGMRVRGAFGSERGAS